ncbi:unnamed protein product, partial [Effrenium voratum]
DYWGGFSWEQVARLQHVRAAMKARAAGQQLYFAQAVDKPTDGRSLSAERRAESGEHDKDRVSHRHVPAVCWCAGARLVHLARADVDQGAALRNPAHRPKEPPVDSRSACVVLRDQPLGVLVEVDDRENSQLQLPAAAETPKGHFFVAPVIEVQRRAQAGQVPLAPREVPAVD